MCEFKLFCVAFMFAFNLFVKALDFILVLYGSTKRSQTQRECSGVPKVPEHLKDLLTFMVPGGT